MSDSNDDVVVKVIKAVRNAQCTANATAAIAKTLTDITKLDKADRGKYLAAIRGIVADDAVNDSDDVADELAAGAAALVATRKATRHTDVAA